MPSCQNEQNTVLLLINRQHNAFQNSYNLSIVPFNIVKAVAVENLIYIMLFGLRLQYYHNY